MNDPLSNLHSGPPDWLQFVERLVPEPVERHRLQRSIGYTFSDNTNGQCIFSVFGPRHSGKTVFVRAIAAVFPGMCISVKQSILTSKSKAQIDARLVRLIGKRFAVCNVSPDGIKINGVQVRDLVTGSRMVFKRDGIGENAITIPTKFWVFSRTALPIYKSETLAYFRVFEFKKDPELAIPGLEAYMTAPSMAEQILQWTQDGLSDWNTWGLS